MSPTAWVARPAVHRPCPSWCTRKDRHGWEAFDHDATGALVEVRVHTRDFGPDVEVYVEENARSTATTSLEEQPNTDVFGPSTLGAPELVLHNADDPRVVLTPDEADRMAASLIEAALFLRGIMAAVS